MTHLLSRLLAWHTTRWRCGLGEGEECAIMNNAYVEIINRGKNDYAIY
jgi:hypothetical protein